jgi:uncharacterized cupredoxin-like copper-binding protein
MRKTLLLAATGALALFGAACDDDGPDNDDALEALPTAVTIAAPSTPLEPGVTVTATDYRFDGLPPTVAAGTTFGLHNASVKEAHEMVMIRIPDEEVRPVSELVTLSVAESDAIFGDIEPATVLIALPGDMGTVVVGDGTLTEPGRYAVVCFIPTGADPAIVEAALSEDDPSGPPDLGDGAPHVMNGMFAEVKVE